MTTLELRLFGEFEARLRHGPALDIPGRRARSLLGFLALPPGQPHPREKLATLLWSDRADLQAQHSLRQSLSTLRKALAMEKFQPLLADRRRVRLDAAVVAVDAVEFEDLLAAGTVEALQQACNLYRGELLEGEFARDQAHEEWLFYERARLHDRALHAFERLLGHQGDADDTEAAAATAQRLLRHWPAHERAHRALMRLHAGRGRRSAALVQYRRCRAALEREFDAAPGPQTEQLFQDILRGRGQPYGAASVRNIRSVPQHQAAPGAGPEIGEPPVRDTLVLPEKPSVAVLPFVNMSSDPGQDYFCNGITEDIITDLSRFRSLNVVARRVPFKYRGRFGEPRQAVRELGVEHIVEGSVQRAGNRVRLWVRLIDAESGNHIWAERYDRDLEDIFTLQDEIAGDIVGHVAQGIDDQRLLVARQRQPESLQAYDYWLRARKHIDTRSLNGIAKGRRLLERVLEIDPHFARAYAYLGQSYIFEAHYSAHGVVESERGERAIHLAQVAMDLDSADAQTILRMGWANMFHREDGLAAEQLEAAATLNPCDTDILVFQSLGRAFMGRSPSSAALINGAARRDPFQPDWHRLHLSTICFLARRFEDAYKLSRRTPDMLPDTAAWKAAVCVQVDRMEEARGLVDRFVRNVHSIWDGKKTPDASAYKQYLLDVNPMRREEDIELLLDSLHRAGLPQ